NADGKFALHRLTGCVICLKLKPDPLPGPIGLLIGPDGDLELIVRRDENQSLGNGYPINVKERNAGHATGSPGERYAGLIQGLFQDGPSGIKRHSPAFGKKEYRTIPEPG